MDVQSYSPPPLFGGVPSILNVALWKPAQTFLLLPENVMKLDSTFPELTCNLMEFEIKEHFQLGVFEVNNFHSYWSKLKQCYTKHGLRLIQNNSILLLSFHLINMFFKNSDRKSICCALYFFICKWKRSVKVLVVFISFKWRNLGMDLISVSNGAIGEQIKNPFKTRVLKC